VIRPHDRKRKRPSAIGDAAVARRTRYAARNASPNLGKSTGEHVMMGQTTGARQGELLHE
jgi:hypothetical protein